MKTVGDVTPKKIKANGKVWRGFEFGKDSRIIINKPLQCYPLCDFRHDVGWRGWKLKDKGTLNLHYKEPGAVSIESKGMLEAGLKGIPQSLTVPYPTYKSHDATTGTLEIHCPEGHAFMAVNEAHDRAELISLCQGHGIEIGPGHQPQVLPSASVDVSYLEEKSIEDWKATYNGQGKLEIDESLWARYKVGKASDMPVDNQSLDFIFCSHLFEHLANPIHHLQYWSEKLRPNGVVAAIVPSLAGSKDYVFRPSSPAEWVAEYESGSVQASRHHFERYAAGRRMEHKLDWMIDTAYSIHVHFYEPENLAMLCRHVVEKGWYTDFSIQYLPNNKDFHFVLRR